VRKGFFSAMAFYGRGNVCLCVCVCTRKHKETQEEEEFIYNSLCAADGLEKGTNVARALFCTEVRAVVKMGNFDFPFS
jgi:hypothetical protein